MVSSVMDFATSLKPDFHQAVIDVISYYGWKNIIYLYSSHEGMYDFSLINNQHMTRRIKYSIFSFGWNLDPALYCIAL